jgi:hypothetical protein
MSASVGVRALRQSKLAPFASEPESVDPIVNTTIPTTVPIRFRGFVLF